MAKITLGGLITSIRGSIGGYTFSRNRAGDFVRRRVVPFNPKTKYQKEARSAFANLVRKWSLLTDAERKTWNDAAKTIVLQQKTKKLGQLQTISGYNLFLSFQRNQEVTSIPFTNSYPGKGQFEPLPIQSVTISVANQSVYAVAGGPVTIASNCVVFTTGYYNKVLTNWDGKYKEVASFEFKNNKPFYYFSQQFIARFGALRKSGGISFQIKSISTTGFGGQTYTVPVAFV